MHIITAHSPDIALSHGLHDIVLKGSTGNSRNGPVLRFPTPVTTVWKTPHRRVSFSPIRDANPFFHLMEAMWMLAGRNDVKMPSMYAKQLATYSDDGQTLNGAYGYRWRNYFGYDQLDAVIAELKKNPESRRCVVSMWNGMNTQEEVETGIGMLPEVKPSDLLNQTSKDLPCNLQCLFDLHNGKLNMTVTNRSNDMIWGAYGANIVHFAFLQEYMADQIGVDVGTYYQVSNNMHVYLDFEITARFLEKGQQLNTTRDGRMLHLPTKVVFSNGESDYTSSTNPMLLGSNHPMFREELEKILDHEAQTNSPDFWKLYQYQTPFFHYVVDPMKTAYIMYKMGTIALAIEHLETAISVAQRDLNNKIDWLYAGLLWLQRRVK